MIDPDEEDMPLEYYLYEWPDQSKQLTRSMHIKNKVEDYFKSKVALPEDHRASIWRSISHLDALLNNPANSDTYKLNLNTPQADIESDVATDAARTYPSDEYKHKLKQKQLDNCKQSLFNVLKAYAIYNEEVQYTQGMNYLALILLCYFGEEESFWMMDILIKKHGMRHFFTKNNTILPSYIKIFEMELNVQLPKLSRHLNDSGIQVYMFVQSWWSTIFVYILPVQSIPIIWDYFFWGSNGVGIEVLFRLSIALLKMLDKNLVNINMIQFFDTIKVQTPQIDPLELVYLAKEIVLTDDTSRFLRDKALSLSKFEDGASFGRHSMSKAIAKANAMATSNSIKSTSSSSSSNRYGIINGDRQSTTLSKTTTSTTTTTTSRQSQDGRQQQQAAAEDIHDDSSDTDIENLIFISDDDDGGTDDEDEVYTYNSASLERKDGCIIS
ncbi:hypothetical protein SAMD00019534_074050, partial [Acytostelium subglobosum LB1]|uniref:hypothetical protein n=1 Tax=Acytostelium subglobosum LB1 TaxID=1410327 RepID=UPI000644CED6